jgi:hypothetical protein
MTDWRLLKCANNTAKICLSDPGYIAKMSGKFVVGGYPKPGDADHEHGSLRFTITVVLPFSFDHSSLLYLARRPAVLLLSQ